MGSVFISYRRDDAAGYARAIHDELTEHFPPERVFMDVDAIEPGLPFDEVIRNAVGKCTVLLVLIGARWLAPGADGRSRLEDERDFVRLEIAAALARGIRVIPVLLDGAPMPGEADLPEALRGLVWRNAIEVSNTRFNSDLERLAGVLARGLDAGPPPEAAGTPAAAAHAAKPAPAVPETDRPASGAGPVASGRGWRYLLGAVVLVAVAAAAWVMWPRQTPAPAPLERQAADARTTVPDFAARPWGVVFGSDRTLDAARDELRRASRSGVDGAAIYLRNGYYVSIALCADRAEAERVMRIVRVFRRDTYVVDMRTWCVQPEPRAGHVECGAAVD